MLTIIFQNLHYLFLDHQHTKSDSPDYRNNCISSLVTLSRSRLPALHTVIHKYQIQNLIFQTKTLKDYLFTQNELKKQIFKQNFVDQIQQCFEMSTFQNFRRSLQNKSNSKIQNISSASIVNIEFSTHQIVFHYEQNAQLLAGSPLKITNYSLHNIYFRIVSNSAQHYQIIPPQDILHSSGHSNVTFKLKKNMFSLNPRDSYTNTFEKICDITHKHIFYVQWGTLSDQQLRENKIPELVSQQILTIKITQPYTNQKNYNSGKRESYSRFQDLKVINQKSLNFINEKQISRAVSKPFDSSVDRGYVLDSEHNLVESNNSLLTTPIIVTVAAVSFLLGFISA